LKVPLVLIISLVSVLAGTVLLAGPFSASSIFKTETQISQVQEAEAAVLPLNVLDNPNTVATAADAANPQLVKVDEDFVDPEHHCEFCTRVEYTPGPQGVAGLAFKGTGALDFTGAKKVRLWVMGEQGDERITFKVAGKNSDNTLPSQAGNLVKGIFKNQQFALSTQEIRLGNDWKKYEVSLSGIDLHGITYPLGLELAKGSTNRPQVVFIKGVVYDTEPPESPVATVKVNANPLTAGIITNDTKGVAPAVFAFKANVTGGTEPHATSWNFGDGKTARGDTVSHTFAKADTYNVRVTVTDSSGQTATDNIKVQVSAPAQKSPSTNSTGENSTATTNSTGG